MTVVGMDIVKVSLLTLFIRRGGASKKSKMVMTGQQTDSKMYRGGVGKLITYNE